MSYSKLSSVDALGAHPTLSARLVTVVAKQLKAGV
jgi:hypothetical protein